jgi:rhamnosyl/mannosyltransferase
MHEPSSTPAEAGATGTLRVLHVYKTWYPDSYGGIEQFIKQLSEQTALLGIANHLFVPSRRVRRVTHDQQGALQITRVPVTLELQSTPFSLSAFGAFRAAAAASDLIHYQFPWPFGDLLHLSGAGKTPGIVSYQSDVVRQRLVMPLYRPLMHAFLRSMKRIVSASPQYLASSPVLQQYRDKVEVIGLGLDPASYAPASPSCLARWQAEVGTGFFLFVGVLRYYKGLHILLDACAGTSLPVVIAGAGPLREELQAQARRLGLDHVHFVGLVSDEDKSALLALCRAVVFPSHLRSEAFGITLLEGALHGKPLISCEIGTGSSHVNQHDVTGLVVPPGDATALRHAMLRLQTDDKTARAMGQAALARFEAHFTAQRIARSYARLYREVLQESAQAERLK